MPQDVGTSSVRTVKGVSRVVTVKEGEPLIAETLDLLPFEGAGTGVVGVLPFVIAVGVP